eukprot:1640249-Pyramimonas_sp.AAC.1
MRRRVVRGRSPRAREPGAPAPAQSPRQMELEGLKVIAGRQRQARPLATRRLHHGVRLPAF